MSKRQIKANTPPEVGCCPYCKSDQVWRRGVGYFCRDCLALFDIIYVGKAKNAKPKNKDLKVRQVTKQTSETDSKPQATQN